MKRLILVLMLLFSLYLLAACTPKTEEDQIAAINKRISPDGFLTKTHLYIHWPAEYTKPRRNDPGGKEIVKAITLKIPMEYLGQSLISFENAVKMENPELIKNDAGVINYASRIKEALHIHDHQITRIYLRLIPNAKPYVPILPLKSDSPEVALTKAEHFLTSYAVMINRNTHFVIPLKDRESRTYSNVTSYELPTEFSCSGDAYCKVYFGIKGRMAEIGGQSEGLDHPNLARFYQENKILPAPSVKGLPKWHEKLDPTEILIKSFVLPDDSPEAKDIFPNQ